MPNCGRLSRELRDARRGGCRRRSPRRSGRRRDASAACARERVPSSGGIVGVVAEQVLEHRQPVPCGCVPCETCASCSGSPSSTTLRAAVPIASASASDTCPASSITSVSTLPSSVRVREQPRGSGEEQDVRAGDRAKLRRVGRAADRQRCRRTTRRCSRSPSSGRGSARPPPPPPSRLRPAGCGSPCGWSPSRRRAGRADEIGDEARARPRLAGAGRTLDEEVALVERGRQRSLLGELGRLDVDTRQRVRRSAAASRARMSRSAG